jgi:hypothetical protein
VAESHEVGGVWFTFLCGPNKTQMVEIMIGKEVRRMPLWEFNKEMLWISEICARRCGKDCDG